MAKSITRQTLNLFGNAGASTNFAEFGSQAAGAPVKTKNIATIQALAAYAQGWQNAVALGNAPYLEDMNSLFYLMAYQLVYNFQEGIAEYDSGTTYYIGSVVKNPSTFELYGSLTDSNTGNALGAQVSNTNWQYLGKLSDFQNLQNTYSNLLDNGGFELWNRGTNFTNPPNGAYVADRWTVAQAGGTPAWTISQDSATVDVGGYSLKMNITAVNGAATANIVQTVPNAISLRGRTVSVSVRVWCNTPGAVSIYLTDNLAASAQVNHPGDSAWHTLSGTITVGATATALNLTVGSVSGTGSVVQVSTTYIDSAMLVIGPSPVSFVPENTVITNLRSDALNVQRNFLVNGGFENWDFGTSFVGQGADKQFASGWFLGAGNQAGNTSVWTVAKETTNIDSPGVAALKLVMTTLGNSGVYIIQYLPNPLDFRGKSMTFSVRVKTTSAGAVATFDDGVTTFTSNAHTGSGNYETLAVTGTVGGTATRAACAVGGGQSSGSIFYIDNAMLVVGTAAAPFVPDEPVIKDLRISAQNYATNILDNGGFEIWQRGTSFSAPAHVTYTADRWLTITTEPAGVTVSRDTTVDTGFYSMKVLVSSASAAKLWTVRQVVENYKDFAGKTITVSVRVNSNTANAIRLVVNDSVSNSYSSYHSGGGTFETLTVTKLLSASLTQLIVDVGMYDPGDKKVGTYYFDSSMLTFGAAFPGYVPVNPQVDMARCQRYYESIPTIYITLYEPVTNHGAPVGLSQPFAVTKRVAPTLTVSSSISLIRGDEGFAFGADAHEWVYAGNTDGTQVRGAKGSASITASADL